MPKVLHSNMPLQRRLVYFVGLKEVHRRSLGIRKIEGFNSFHRAKMTIHLNKLRSRNKVTSRYCADPGKRTRETFFLFNFYKIL